MLCTADLSAMSLKSDGTNNRSWIRPLDTISDLFRAGHAPPFMMGKVYTFPIKKGIEKPGADSLFPSRKAVEIQGSQGKEI